MKRFCGAGCVLALAVLLVAACSTAPNQRLGQVERRVPGGDVRLGHDLIVQYGCMSCHTIPGIPQAVALVGPPLNQFEQRSYIAGALTNTTENLIAWLVNPQAIEPGTAMPNLNVTEEEARHMVAYLYIQTR